MNIAFHTGKSAMIAQAQALNVYGNNIANVNTVGYQTLRPDFADCIYVTERRTEADWQTGHGTYIQKTDLMFDEAHYQETGSMLHFATAGEGFFAVQDRYGEVNYTRDGSFQMTQDPDTEEWYLVSNNGEYVLDANYNRIIVEFQPAGKNTIIDAMDWNAVLNQIGAFTSDDPQNLRVRYTYNGEITEETPARNVNAAKTLTPSVDEGAIIGARVATNDGYFAVRDRYGQISYTRDNILSMQSYEGQWYLGSSNGGFVLDYNNQMIPLDFGEAPTYDYFRLNWNEIGPQAGVFTFNEGELSTDSVTRFNFAATADANIAKTSGEAALSDVVFGNNEAMFAVESENGIRYTHNVTLDVVFDETADLNNDGEPDGAWYLSTVQGEYVLDNNNQRVLISENVPSNNVDYSAVKAAVGVFEFPNPYGLEAGGQNRYIMNGKSGDAVAVQDPDMLQGFLCVSNVDLATQMVKLIETQRAYQISSRVVMTADEMQRIANNLR